MHPQMKLILVLCVYVFVDVCVCVLYVCACVCVYVFFPAGCAHVASCSNNYVTYSVAMRPYFSQLWQFRQLFCVATMSSLALL